MGQSSLVFAGGGLLTVRVTGISAGDPCAPLAVMVIWPLYVPVMSPPTATAACSVCGAVPDVGETESQAALSLAVKDIIPVPVLVTLSEPGNGAVPPCV